ncbi:tRNA pseudouridine synthase B [Anaeromyxobacter dehalogenans 2CP-1]|uniref:tRNA pseudouridine synthase B n=1 Tax=Anaeromyxobacter dehalogenans (strain ATCC BAA-258 / DSM 21875 / 2CP-1) TaxID=455488 RepID=B8JFY9_ANAD2|nr:tRNA pseudouridine(55) synthase TruB [Anaeromyxobacter dehalogenans]ACL64577.1 tRNA pseudouridine synthase B [Anaeromyxobacter dehalogenans 2CP-1]
MRPGVLVVDKPAGPTSFEVVRRIRRALGAARAGHAGTLDPAATGVLAICVEDGVKLQQFLSDGDKAYDAAVAFGAATSTEDADGEVTARGDASALTEDALRAALAGLTGDIEQVPPMYSAVRVGGRRLHEVARAGETVDRTPRRVRVHALELGGLDAAPGPDGLRRARVAVRCGKGTYVRTLAADLGRALGVPAHLAALRRTMASGFDLSRAIGLEDAEALARDHGREALAERIVPMADALGALGAIRLGEREAWDLVHGRPVPRPPGAPGVVRALAPDGRLVAVCAPGEGRLRTLRVFLGPSDLRAGPAQNR